MSVDKFGRYSFDSGIGTRFGPQAPRVEGFKLTADGNYDMDNKLLCNVADPLSAKDAANLSTVQTSVDPCLRLDKKRKYDAMNTAICNVADPVNRNDVVTMGFFEARVPKKSGAGGYSFGSQALQDVQNPSKTETR